MEYQTYIWMNPIDNENYILVRTEPSFGQITQGAIFQSMLKEKFGLENVIPMVIDPNGIHTVLTYGVPLNLTDEWLEELNWETHIWG